MTDLASAPADTAPAPAVSTLPRTRRLRRWLVRLVGGAAVLMLMASALTAALEARDVRRFPAPGDLVELSDGRVLHLVVAGEHHDGPVVVLDAGAGGFSPVFAWLQAELAERVTVVAYDRPGYGWSSPVDRPIALGDTAADLHEALSRRGLSGPYVLVGHSLGGLYVRAFTDRYPAEVAGLVLLDPAHEDQLEYLPAETVAEMEQMGRALLWGARLARLGLFRLYNPNAAVAADLPESAAARLTALTATAAYWRASGEEADAFTDLAAATPSGLGDVPARVVSATRAAPGEQDLRVALDALHRELVEGSALATRNEVVGADHLTLLTDGDHAREAARIVAELLDDLALP